MTPNPQTIGDHAELEARKLGHNLGKWFAFNYHRLGGITAKCCCMKCGAEVVIDTTPTSHKTIGGAAVTFSCHQL